MIRECLAALAAELERRGGSQRNAETGSLCAALKNPSSAPLWIDKPFYRIVGRSRMLARTRSLRINEHSVSCSGLPLARVYAVPVGRRWIRRPHLTRAGILRRSGVSVRSGESIAPKSNSQSQRGCGQSRSWSLRLSRRAFG